MISNLQKNVLPSDYFHMITLAFISCITVSSGTLQSKQITLLGFSNIWMGITATTAAVLGKSQATSSQAHLFFSSHSASSNTACLSQLLQAMDHSQHMPPILALAVPEHSDLGACFFPLHSWDCHRINTYLVYHSENLVNIWQH